MRLARRGVPGGSRWPPPATVLTYWDDDDVVVGWSNTSGTENVRIALPAEDAMITSLCAGSRAIPVSPDARPSGAEIRSGGVVLSPLVGIFQISSVSLLCVSISWLGP